MGETKMLVVQSWEGPRKMEYAEPGKESATIDITGDELAVIEKTEENYDFASRNPWQVEA